MARCLWLLAALVAGIEKPAECPASSWTAECLPSVTCESLATAGFFCSTVAEIGSCNTACTLPCCITTTSTTITMTTVTLTSQTATETLTSETMTVTETVTATTVTGSTFTTTHTGTSATHTVTTTQSVTSQTVTATLTKTTTTSTENAAKITVTMMVIVGEKLQSYVEDERVKKAYKELMVEITGLDPKLVDVDLSYDGAPADSGDVMVSYTITVPWEDGAYLVPVGSVKTKMDGLSLASLNAMLDEKVNEATGGGEYKQEVEAMGDHTAINAARGFALGLLVFLVSVQAIFM